MCTGGAPLVELGDINLVVTTDLHSWIEGRTHEPFLNATLGHAVSLVERLKELARTQGRDVFFFDNGDINDGTGLSAIAQDHVARLAPLMQLAPYDALNIGNHELYQLNSRGAIPGEACAITGLNASGYIASWGGRYLTSNVVWASSGQPIGSRFRLLEGEFGTHLLVFGFLYNMPDHCNAVEVHDVNATVHSQWFLDTLRDRGRHSDAIVVLAHMDYRDDLVDLILNSIRAVAGVNKPVQFLTGHSHIRGWRRLDDFASSYEAGCKLDTLGFASFNKASPTQLAFNHVDIDGNTARLAEAANSSEAELLLHPGEELHRAITRTRASLGLDETLGCAERHYHVWAPVSAEDSLWAYYMQYVVPATLFEAGGRPQWSVIGTGSLVYDVYEGPFKLDDAYLASPFGNYWFALRGLPGSALKELLRHLPGVGAGAAAAEQQALRRRLRVFGAGEATALANATAGEGEAVPDYVTTGPLEESQTYDFIYCDFDADTFEGLLRNITKKEMKRSVYREGSNTSSLLVEWFRRKPCLEQTRFV